MNRIFILLMILALYQSDLEMEKDVFFPGEDVVLKADFKPNASYLKTPIGILPLKFEEANGSYIARYPLKKDVVLGKYYIVADSIKKEFFVDMYSVNVKRRGNVLYGEIKFYAIQPKKIEYVLIPENISGYVDVYNKTFKINVTDKTEKILIKIYNRSWEFNVKTIKKEKIKIRKVYFPGEAISISLGFKPKKSFIVDPLNNKHELSFERKDDKYLATFNLSKDIVLGEYKLIVDNIIKKFYVDFYEINASYINGRIVGNVEYYFKEPEKIYYEINGKKGYAKIENGRFEIPIKLKAGNYTAVLKCGNAVQTLKIYLEKFSVDIAIKGFKAEVLAKLNEKPVNATITVYLNGKRINKTIFPLEIEDKIEIHAIAKYKDYLAEKKKIVKLNELFKNLKEGLHKIDGVDVYKGVYLAVVNRSVLAVYDKDFMLIEYKPPHSKYFNDYSAVFTFKVNKTKEKIKIKAKYKLKTENGYIYGYLKGRKIFRMKVYFADSYGFEIKTNLSLNKSTILAEAEKKPKYLIIKYETSSFIEKKKKIKTKILKSDREIKIGKLKLSLVNGIFKDVRVEKFGEYVFIKFNITNVTRGAATILINAENVKYVKFDNGFPYVYSETYSDSGITAVYLQDGGIGDEDGVKNGVIVDPAFIIAGRVYEDVEPLEYNFGEDVPKAGAKVRLFKDDGNLVLDANDSLKLETYTNATGDFVFKIEAKEWWNSSWSLRRAIIITNTNNRTLINYPVKIIVNTQELISQGKLRSDCGDIRFVDANNNLLGYWIKPNTCNTTATEIWVNVTRIENNSETTIYMYYNNSNATSLSDPWDVFYFYEDFENGLGNFTPVDGNTVNNLWRWTNYRFYEGNYSAAFNEPDAPEPDYCVGGEYVDPSTGLNYCGYQIGWFFIPTPVDGYLISSNFYLGEDAFVFWYDWTETEKTGCTFYAGTPSDPYDNLYFEISTDGGATWSLVKRWECTSQSWVLRMLNLSNYTSPNARIRFYFDSVDHIENDYEGWYIDNVIVRKYIPPEPTASVQGEESIGEPINGTYFVAVEAESVIPERWNGLKAKPEQTYGSSFLESLSVYPELGGKNALREDNWTALVYEHYATVNETELRNVSGLAFGFAFNIVVNNLSYGQGSLYQAIENSNAIDKPVNITFLMLTERTINVTKELRIKNPNRNIENYSIELVSDLNYSLVIMESNTSIAGLNFSKGGIKITSYTAENGSLPLGERFVRRILINNSLSNEPLIEYQINFTIDTQNLIALGKMRSDCGDIRFYDPIAEEWLSYYISNISTESCNTTSTRIWVKVPYVAAHGYRIIYMYYGNLSLTPQSSGERTFEFFEDWESGFNTSKWSRSGSDPTLFPYWNVSTGVGAVLPQEGSYMLASENLPELAWVKVNTTIALSTGSEIIFYWRNEGSGGGTERLEFILNGAVKAYLTGNTSWLLHKETLAAGEYSLAWKKSTNWNALGTNRGYLDLIIIRKKASIEPIVNVSGELPEPEKPRNIVVKDLSADAVYIKDADKVRVENSKISSIEVLYSNLSSFKVLEADSIMLKNVYSSNFSNINTTLIRIENSSENMFNEILFLSNYSTLVNFTYSGNIILRGVDAPPSDPEGAFNIGKYVNITNTSRAWVFINFSYEDGAFNEETLSVWKFNGSWYKSGWNGSRVLDTDRNIVGVNITYPGGIFAPLVSIYRNIGANIKIGFEENYITAIITVKAYQKTNYNVKIFWIKPENITIVSMLGDYDSYSSLGSIHRWEFSEVSPSLPKHVYMNLSASGEYSPRRILIIGVDPQ